MDQNLDNSVLMAFYVYMIKTISSSVKKSYVGFSNNVNKRLKKHNSNKGAKSTKGHKWKLIYQKKFASKSKAMSFEYKLKNDKKKRLSILKKFYN